MNKQLSTTIPTKRARKHKTPSIWDFFTRISLRFSSFAVWGSFLLLLFLFRSFLSLIFITFILSYAINSLLVKAQERVTWPRWALVLLIYVTLGVLISGIGMTLFPKVYQESKSISREIPEAKDKMIRSLKDNLLSDPDFAKFLDGMDYEQTIKDWLSPIITWVTTFLQNLFRTSFHFVLSMIFSFLIIWDLDRLRTDTQSLKETRLAKAYEILGPMLVQFGSVVGKAFEAQIMIACVNTILTLIGLTLMGIPSQLFLSVFVFFCSFIPVLGVFISSLPICLMAYKTQGFMLVTYSALMITIIHFIEAYILNPRIVGSQFSLHPFLAVCILVISETWFGVWGLLLGVPIAVFVYRSFLLLPESTPAPEKPAEKKLVLES